MKICSWSSLISYLIVQNQLLLQGMQYRVARALQFLPCIQFILIRLFLFIFVKDRYIALSNVFINVHDSKTPLWPYILSSTVLRVINYDQDNIGIMIWNLYGECLSEMLIDSYLLQKIKQRCKLEDDSEHSDQREDGDENLVVCSAGNSLGCANLSLIPCCVSSFCIL